MSISLKTFAVNATDILDESISGASSTISAPMIRQFFSSITLRKSKKSLKDAPPASGVPVPGTKLGSK